MIGRYKEKREPFDLLAAKFKSEAMQFSGGNHFGAGGLSKQAYIRNSKWQTQNPSKSLKKPLLRQKDNNTIIAGKVIQRLFNIELYTYLAMYRYR